MNPETKPHRKPGNKYADFGKVPPQSLEAEEAVLGAVLLEDQAMHELTEIIKTEQVFYKNAHQQIWRAMKMLHISHSRIDTITVSEQLKKLGTIEEAGGAYYLIQLTNKIGSAANVAYHARILVENYIKREIIKASSEMIGKAYDETTDAIDLLGYSASAIEEVNLYIQGQAVKDWAETVADEADRLRTAGITGETVTGVPTGSETLDRHMLGWQPGNLIIIAGRPGMGKTTVAWHIARNQLKQGIPVGFVSLEMKDRELIRKMFSAEIQVDSQKLRRGDLADWQWGKLDDKLPDMMAYPIQMEDRAGITISQLEAKIKYWIRKHKIQAVYIDLIGKIVASDGNQKFFNREAEISHISGRLKILAGNMNIPIILLAQLSRRVEERTDKRPVLSDLRDSGAIEQDADIVIFPYRPGYYGIETDEDGQRYPENVTLLDIAKYRDGAPDCVIKWIFEPQYSNFYDYNADNYYSTQKAGSDGEPF